MISGIAVMIVSTSIGIMVGKKQHEKFMADIKKENEREKFEFKKENGG